MLSTVPNDIDAPAGHQCGSIIAGHRLDVVFSAKGLDLIPKGRHVYQCSVPRQ